MQQQSHYNVNANANQGVRRPLAVSVGMLDSGAGGLLNVGGGATTPSTSTPTCQDCGNQAKKDCNHRRCRTCCKGRGFDCSTHVKSTWIPAARRRETHLTVAGGASSGSTSLSKRPRLGTTTSNASNSNNTTPHSFDDTTTSSHQENSLPRQVQAPALFKCVKVTAVEDSDGEYAYQAMVKIGGHVFKGFLYDQGPNDRDDRGDGTNKESNNNNNHNNMPNISELNLGGGGRGGGGRCSSVYVGGTNYGN